MKIAITSTILFAILSSLSLIAQTNVWNGSISSSWHDAANWSLYHEPLAGEDVVINVTNDLIAILENTQAFAASLDLSNGANLLVRNTGSLTIDGGVSSDPTKSGIKVSSASIENNGLISIRTTRANGLSLDGAPIFGSGQVKVEHYGLVAGGFGLRLANSSSSLKGLPFKKM